MHNSLVAAFEVSHPRHPVCLPWLQQAQTEQIQGLIATHTLAELYSVLTRLPVRPRISPEVAQRLITENLERFEVIPLTTEDYQMVLAQMVSLNLTGGGIYDALIAQAAVKAEWLYWYEQLSRRLLAPANVIEQERQRADRAEQQLEQERQRAERLAERLRQMGVDPDML